MPVRFVSVNRITSSHDKPYFTFLRFQIFDVPISAHVAHSTEKYPLVLVKTLAHTSIFSVFRKE